MDMDLFIKKLKEAKTDTRYTAFYRVKVVSNRDRTYQNIYRDETCKYCKQGHMQSVKVYFKRPQPLTIFQAEMLFAVFYLKKRPADYASYHKCISGKDFVENIEKIIVEGMED
jgi:hypothetical protein